MQRRKPHLSQDLSAARRPDRLWREQHTQVICLLVFLLLSEVKSEFPLFLTEKIRELFGSCSFIMYLEM